MEEPIIAFIVILGCKCSNSFYIVTVTAANLDFDITNGF